MENQKGFKISQYACAVLLIVSSIALVANDMNAIDGVRLSPHFRLGEFLNLNKNPENIPTMQVVANLTYDCTSPGILSLSPATTSASVTIDDFCNSGPGPRVKIIVRLVQNEKNSAKRGNLFGFLLIFAMSLINVSTEFKK